MVELATKYRISADQFVRMAEAGVFPEDARLELIDGEIVEMRSIGPRHAEVTSRLIDVFASLRGRATLRVQCPGRVGPYGMPEPDFVLARPRPGGHADRHPQPADLLLLVEVAESSLPYDREEKGPLYARHGIAEYWIMNLVEACLEVHREPRDGVWTERRVLAAGEEIAPLAFPDRRVRVADLLP